MPLGAKSEGPRKLKGEKRLYMEGERQREEE
jgi:hypothetical protein